MLYLGSRRNTKASSHTSARVDKASFPKTGFDKLLNGLVKANKSALIILMLQLAQELIDAKV